MCRCYLSLRCPERGVTYKDSRVTTSYINPAMQELDSEAKEAGITVLNEIGLDPGIDHLYVFSRNMEQN